MGNNLLGGCFTRRINVRSCQGSGGGGGEAEGVGGRLRVLKYIFQQLFFIFPIMKVYTLADKALFKTVEVLILEVDRVKVYSTNRDCIRTTMVGWQCKPQGGGDNFNGEKGIPLCNTVLLNLYCLTGYCKRCYRITLFLIFLLFYLFCISWQNQGQKCKLKCPKIY